MNWGTDFSFTFQAPATPKTERDLFAVPRLSETPHGPDFVTAVNPHNGKSAVLPLEVASALTYCARFRTLEEHVTEFIGDAPPNDPRRPAIKEVLDQVWLGGLMISGQEQLTKFKPAPGSTAAEGPLAAVIITCDRPRALERLLDSIAANTDASRLEELIVVDDSRAEGNQQKNRDIVVRLQTAIQTRLRYFGAEEAQQFTERLIRSVPRHEAAIRFLLDRGKWADFYSAGVARNWSHVLTIGRRVVVFDDDTVCEFWRSPFAADGCELNQPRRQALFYDNLEDEQRLVSSPGEDPVTALTDCLGLSLAQSLDVLSIGQPTLDALKHADPDKVMRLSADSKILVSECGSVGDPGTADYKWLLWLHDETLERMVREPAQADRALAHDPCWLGVDKISFANGANMSQLTGFDNREILPPYMPVDRGQDLFFGEMVQFLYPGSVSLNYNWGITHLRVSPETAQGPAARDMSSHAWLSSLTMLPIKRMDECTESSLLDRLRVLSSFFAELAAMENEDIVEQATTEFRDKRKFQVEEIQRCLDSSPDLPESIRRHMQEAAASFSTGELPAAHPWADSADVLRFWKTTWSDFGKALVAWPEIREAAKTIQ